MFFVRLECTDCDAPLLPTARKIVYGRNHPNGLEWRLSVYSGEKGPITIILPFSLSSQRLDTYRQLLKDRCDNPSLFPPGSFRSGRFARIADEVSYAINGLVA